MSVGRRANSSMPDRELLVAFVSGPMYDTVYERLAHFKQVTGIHVEIGFHGSHPQLNAHLASLSNGPYDLVSTHTKYAPSQLAFLAPLDTVAGELDIHDFYPPVINLARVKDRLFGIPRNIDVKLLHFRAEFVERVPQTWDELVETASRLASKTGFYGFVFPGTDSGLFGLFYELAEMGAANLLAPSNELLLNNEGGQWGLEVLTRLYRSRAVPPDIIHWHYDEAHRCFRDGHAAMSCDWPGYYGAYRDATVSKVHSSMRLARMPAGPHGAHKAYSVCHTFALTRRGLGQRDALELLRFLTAPEQQMLAAHYGSVPTRPAVLAQVRSKTKASEAERWILLDLVIANDMLIPPTLSYYPEIEEIIWRTVRAAMIGEITIHAALTTMEDRITECHRRHARGQ